MPPTIFYKGSSLCKSCRNCLKRKWREIIYLLIYRIFFPICGMRCWRLQGNLKSKGKRLDQLKKLKGVDLTGIKDQ